MKKFLMCLLLIPLFGIRYLIRFFPDQEGILLYLPDACIALATVFIFMKMISSEVYLRIPARYLLIFVGFIFLVLCGFIVNNVQPDVIFAGIRMYFKYVPIFLLPIVYSFDRSDYKFLFVLLGLLLLVQLPVTVYQRFFEFGAVDVGSFGGWTNGDTIVGTLENPASITLFALSAVVLAISFFLAGKLNVNLLAIIVGLALIPIALCETKITPVVLPITIFYLLFLYRDVVSAGRIITIGVAVSVFLSGFVVAYDQLYGDGRGGYLNFMTSKEQTMDTYNLTGVRGKKFRLEREVKGIVGEPVNDLKSGGKVDHQFGGTRVGRIDSIILPFDMLLPEHWLRFLLGLGIGSTVSEFGEGGKYLYVSKDLGGVQTEFALLIWETGLFGLLLYAAFIVTILKYVTFQKFEDPYLRAINAAFGAILLLWLFSFIYKSLLSGLPSTQALFMLTSGCIVNTEIQLAAQKVKKRSQARAAQFATITTHMGT